MVGEKFVIVESDLALSVGDLYELANALETQNTTDRLEAGSYNIEGNYSNIYITVNEDGDIIV